MLNSDNYGIANKTILRLLIQVHAVINDTSFNESKRMAINAAGTKGYVCNSNACTVSVVDLLANIVTDVITGFDERLGFAITPDRMKEGMSKVQCILKERGAVAFFPDYDGRVIGAGEHYWY